VRDLPATNKDKYPLLYDTMLSAARAGRTVVRLKGGDPLVFGRGAEEVEVLRDSGILYEVVPGVTTALAMAAYLDLPLTHRLHTGAIALVTGHEVPGRSLQPLDWQALAAFPGTLAIYMGMARIPLIVAELLRHGLAPMTPAMIAERVSTGEMRSIQTTLVDLERARRQAGLEAPGLILIGEAARQKQPSWFERLPLFNRRVLVTRPRAQAKKLVEQLEHLGAVVSELPILQIREVADSQELDAALQRMSSPENGYDWVVFVSANGVEQSFQRLRQLGKDVRAFGLVRIAAVGPKTAEALAEVGIRADVVPHQHIAEGLIASLRQHVAQQRVLLLRANRGRNTLTEELGQIAHVDSVVAYEQTEQVDVGCETYAALRRGEVEFVTLTSSNTARALLTTFDDTMRHRVARHDIKLVALGSETARSIDALGFPVAATAEPHTNEGLIAALCSLAEQPRHSS
jgi:uroporphyrinogen III methyltransferase/synthase